MKRFDSILCKVERMMEPIKIDLDDETWTKSIRSKEAGWYLIKTDAPIKILKSATNPKKHHTNIPETIEETSILNDFRTALTQSGHVEYVVYSGETADLKARARAHVSGHKETYCLGLSNYRRILRKYNWTFCYLSESACRDLPISNKIFRVAIEQAWRAKHGWPILCKR